MARYLKVEEKHRDVAKALLAGKTITEAMLAAGYSPKLARQGRRRIPKAVQEAMLEISGQHFGLLGQRLLADPKALEHHIIGWLYHSMLARTNGGVSAARALIQHRSVSGAFTQEQQNNVVVIQAPSDWKPTTLGKEKPKELERLPELPEYE